MTAPGAIAITVIIIALVGFGLAEILERKGKNHGKDSNS
jgi:hypothetical protein